MKEFQPISSAFKHGQLLLLEEGELPIAGQITIHIKLWSPASEEQQPGVLGSVAGSISPAEMDLASGLASMAVATPAKGSCHRGDGASPADAVAPVMEAEQDMGKEQEKTGKEEEENEEAEDGALPVEAAAELRRRCVRALGELSISRNDSLDDLKASIISRFGEQLGADLTVAQMRLRELGECNVPAKCYRDGQKSLHKHRISNGRSVIVERLQEPEPEGQALLLWVQHRRICGEAPTPQEAGPHMWANYPQWPAKQL